MGWHEDLRITNPAQTEMVLTLHNTNSRTRLEAEVDGRVVAVKPRAGDVTFVLPDRAMHRVTGLGGGRGTRSILKFIAHPPGARPTREMRRELAGAPGARTKSRARPSGARPSGARPSGARPSGQSRRRLVRKS